MKNIINFLDPSLSLPEYSFLRQSKGSMDEARLKIRVRTYLEEALADLQKDGAPALSQLMQEEIEIAYEAGYKAGIVDSTRRETPEVIPENTRLN